MSTGIVKWFNNTKGFGFICPEAGGEDIFAHFSAILMEGYKSLKAGQHVEFEVNPGPKGLHAVNIRADGSNFSANIQKVVNSAHLNSAGFIAEEAALNQKQLVAEAEEA